MTAPLDRLRTTLAELEDSLDLASIADAAALLAATQARLLARAGASASAAAPVSDGPADRLLTAEQVAPRLGVAVRWLYRHADELPYTRRLSRGVLRFSAAGLEHELAGRRETARGRRP